ncbi:TPA: ADP-specific phosphofructokinase [Methanosarcina acetivorans]|uniref:ADP-specific phosphofructokinase n=2 Tax=Methanosarcina acetivorans TaxID=2214 RepID=K6PF_METAC|nr:ADP-specific phosphofructokinase [Methanosarcina acetivorans]P58847.1 RecName: Full=ADP-specific phosphofructokinase; AltName: Full=ADP-dependent phosphofructokinase; Short=ADP-Pfk [Methanosarcina acetivorans C2A]AAM06924.1 6-phosphofructokinase (ADP-dependent) [Methanosarcina acetivorans C2A]HIH94843.1 ADP-specific phosphofructokinase [Methanosarcina acetivorans]
MDIEEWEQRHAEAFYNAKEALPYLDGMFVAYNSNIDAIRHLTEEDLSKLVGFFDESDIQDRVAAYPREIAEPLDFVARLLISMREGKAAEVPAYTADIHEWLKEHLGFDYARMGGQAGIISNLLGRLGLKKVVAYVPWLSEEQAEYFTATGNILHPKVENGKVLLKPPGEAFKPGIGSKVNWILEYSKDMNVTCAGNTFKVPRDNRLIISSRPKWLRLDMDKQIYEQLDTLLPVDGAMLSGYQMIKEEYEDGSTYKDYVENSVKVIEKLKSLNPELRIHVELTSIQNRLIRKAILTEIVARHVHSLGLDTVEVANALNVLGHEELSYSVIRKGENGIMSLYQGAVQLMKDLDLERVHVHSLGFYICILAKGHPLTLKEHRDSLLFSSVLAAAQALNGNIENLAEAEAGLEVPVSSIGLEDLENFQLYCTGRKLCTPDEFEYGYVYGSEHDAILIPSKVVERPKATVGIGDTISAGAFVAMLAKIKQKHSGK